MAERVRLRLVPNLEQDANSARSRRSDEESWYALAACRFYESRLWFSSNRHATELAIDICRHCVVAPECLALALAHPDVVGIWGGTDEIERAQARRSLLLTAP